MLKRFLRLVFWVNLTAVRSDHRLMRSAHTRAVTALILKKPRIGDRLISGSTDNAINALMNPHIKTASRVEKSPSQLSIVDLVGWDEPFSESLVIRAH